MADFAKVAKEVLQILQSFDYTVSLYDDEGMKVTEPEEARRFFDRPKNLMVAIVDDDNSSIELSYGKTTHANDIMGLDLALKSLATKFSLLFSAKQFGKRIEPKSVTTLGSITERKHMILSLIEGMYGTTRSSYLRLEHARMVVRHSRRIDDSMIGARGRCVESIFIENDSGERLLFPSTQLAPARAMTQHVNQGGTFGDDVGGHIMHMSKDYANLSQASNFVGNNTTSLAEGAMAVREACRGKMRKLRKTFERLSKASSYAKESATVIEHANTLNETGDNIDETRLSELRQLLNDADLPREVYECASRAMDEMKESAPITEAEEAEEDDLYVPNANTTIGVLGYRVDKTAWKHLEHGLLVVSGPPQKKKDDTSPEFPDKFTEICFNLGRWVPVISDVTMANLLSSIIDKMIAYRETGALDDGGISNVRNPAKEAEWKRKFSVMATIAMKALKARKVRVKPPEKKKATNFGNGVPAVAEHFSWLDRFNPDTLLVEDMGLGDWGDPIGDNYGDAKHAIVSSFDAHEFVTSPEVSDVIGERDSKNPDENHLEHDEVTQALRDYVQRQLHETGEPDSFSLYLNDVNDDDEIVDLLYDDACEALQNDGWIVQNTSNVEETSDGDDFEEPLDEVPQLDGNLDLDMDDIMLPDPHQGRSLAREVSKATVDDGFGHEEAPDDSYLARIMALSGRNQRAY